MPGRRRAATLDSMTTPNVATPPRPLAPLPALGIVLGGGCLAAAYATLRHPSRARASALGSSAVMVSWTAAQVAMIGYRSPLQPLQPLLAGTGVALTYLATRP